MPRRTMRSPAACASWGSSPARVEVLAAGPIGAEPLLVQIGFTRFALRRAEAARVRVTVEAEATA